MIRGYLLWIPTMTEEINLYRALALRIYSAHLVNWVSDRISVVRVVHIELWLKIWILSFADQLWSVIAVALGLKTIPYLLDTNSTHTFITNTYLITLYICDYMGYACHVQACCEMQPKSQVTTWARTSQSAHTTGSWIIAHIITRLSPPTERNIHDKKQSFTDS